MHMLKNIGELVWLGKCRFHCGICFLRAVTLRKSCQVAHDMHRVIKRGRVPLIKGYCLKDLIVHLTATGSRRNMSSEKRPVSLLGTMAFGGRADAEPSRDMVQAFLDRGHNQVDTAYMYMDGKSETIIGGMHLPKTGIAEYMPGSFLLTRAAFSLNCNCSSTLGNCAATPLAKNSTYLIIYVALLQEMLTFLCFTRIERSIQDPTVSVRGSVKVYVKSPFEKGG